MNDGIEALRKLCGGHGYSQLSGLPELSANYLAIATLEGTQQVGSHADRKKAGAGQQAKVRARSLG